MSKNKEALAKQQVLFNESDTVVEAADTSFKESPVDSNFTQQVMFANDDYLPSVHPDTALDSPLNAEFDSEQLNQDIEEVQGTKKPWLWRVIVSTFLMLLLVEAYEFFTIGFEQSPIITSIYALLFSSLTLVAGHSLWRELLGLRQFKSRQKVKKQASQFLNIASDTQSDRSNKGARDFCDNISKNLPCDVVFEQDEALTPWFDAVSNEHNSAELLQIYSRVVLSKVDEKALNEITRFSTEAVVLIALSPVAIIDMLIMLSRNLRMINKIAGLYGLKLGYWSRIKLIRQVFINMAYAGASELIADFGSDMLGAELVGKLSARFAQGLGAGLLTARLGAKTMELCRPIPFEEKPKLSAVRKNIAEKIKALISR